MSRVVVGNPPAGSLRAGQLPGCSSPWRFSSCSTTDISCLFFYFIVFVDLGKLSTVYLVKLLRREVLLKAVKPGRKGSGVSSHWQDGRGLSTGLELFWRDVLVRVLVQTSPVKRVGGEE